MKNTSEFPLSAQSSRSTISCTLGLRSGVCWSGPAVPAPSSFHGFTPQFAAAVVIGLELIPYLLVVNVAAPLALYSLIQTPGGEAGALRLVILSVLLSLAALGVSEALARRLRARLDD